MNLSLRSRVAASFVIANLSILVLSFFVFNFLGSLNDGLDQLGSRTNEVNVHLEQIRINVISIFKNQKKLALLNVKKDLALLEELRENIINSCNQITSKVQAVEAFYQGKEIKQITSLMITHVSSLRSYLEKNFLYNRGGQGLQDISDYSDKILDTFADYQDIQKQEGEMREMAIKETVIETKRNMMITLIIGFLTTIILGLVIPGKIALPFKKIKDAIRELQECNFDVSIYYNQEDEIGEIAAEMNKMIKNFKVFEELRKDRISVEMRKFDALANLARRPVLVSDAQGKLIYMNNKMFSLMEVQSDDVLGRAMAESMIPESIIHCYDLAIKRRSKIENEEILIKRKIFEEVDVFLDNINHGGPEDLTEIGDDTNITNLAMRETRKEKREREETVYEGYANVIPIRGKDSTLDYYLMVLSREVFS